MKFKHIFLYKILIIIATIIIFIVIPFLFLLINFNWQAGKDLQFNISEGQGTREIAQNLKNEKLIGSSWLFSVYIYQKRWFLQPGVYKIKKEMHFTDLAVLFSEGKIEEYLVTIPEGWRVAQIDAEFAQRKIIQKGELLKIASANEGYLFPDTYRFDLKTDANTIKTKMMEDFKTKTKDLKINRETIILASIIEREARLDEDRAKIAGVYDNRLKLGMKLDADPTIQYAKGNWEPILQSDYKNFQSPYNTYLYAGLPPSPICNPGLKSITAALNPEDNDYLFFFHTKDGKAIFSKTLAEHNENLNKYH